MFQLDKFDEHFFWLQTLGKAQNNKNNIGTVHLPIRLFLQIKQLHARKGKRRNVDGTCLRKAFSTLHCCSPPERTCCWNEFPRCSTVICLRYFHRALDMGFTPWLKSSMCASNSYNCRTNGSLPVDYRWQNEGPNKITLGQDAQSSNQSINHSVNQSVDPIELVKVLPHLSF